MLVKSINSDEVDLTVNFRRRLAALGNFMLSMGISMRASIHIADGRLIAKSRDVSEVARLDVLVIVSL